MLDEDKIIKVNIEEEMKSSYIDYSMSVIVAPMCAMDLSRFTGVSSMVCWD